MVFNTIAQRIRETHNKC